MVTEIVRNNLRKLADTATEGPWRWWNGMLLGNTSDEVIIWPRNVSAGDNTTERDQLGSCGIHVEEHAEDNIRFIEAANPKVIIELLDDIEKMKELLYRTQILLVNPDHNMRQWMQEEIETVLGRYDGN